MLHCEVDSVEHCKLQSVTISELSGVHLVYPKYSVQYMEVQCR